MENGIFCLRVSDSYFSTVTGLEYLSLNKHLNNTSMTTLIMRDEENLHTKIGDGRVSTLLYYRTIIPDRQLHHGRSCPVAHLGRSTTKKIDKAQAFPPTNSHNNNSRPNNSSAK